MGINFQLSINKGIKSMKRKIAISCRVALLSVIAFGQMSVLSQKVPQSVFGAWQDVMAIQPREQLDIRLMNGKGLKGTVDAVTDTEISVSHEGKIVGAERSDIKQVYRVTQKRSNRPVIFGAIIGAVVGIGGTAAVAATNGADGIRAGAAVLPVVGTLTGALVGLAFRNKTKKVLIFEQN